MQMSLNRVGFFFAEATTLHYNILDLFFKTIPVCCDFFHNSTLAFLFKITFKCTKAKSFARESVFGKFQYFPDLHFCTFFIMSYLTKKFEVQSCILWIYQYFLMI